MPQQLLWLPGTLRAAGLAVREIPGWQQRGHGGMSDGLAGVLCHHTAGPAAGLYPSERVVTLGRPGLAGPLCNLGLDRAGTWIVVAAGQGWHAGTGSTSWCRAGEGNSRLIGVEAESTGVTQPNGDWTAAQRVSYPRGVAALLKYLKLGPERAIGHKEWSPGRKIDPAFWDMAKFRSDVSRWMNTTPGPVPAPPTPPAPLRSGGDDITYIKCQVQGPNGPTSTAMWCGPMFVALGPTEVPGADDNIRRGALVQWVEPGTWHDLDRRSHTLCDSPRAVVVAPPAL